MRTNPTRLFNLNKSEFTIPMNLDSFGLKISFELIRKEVSEDHGLIFKRFLTNDYNFFRID